MIWEKISYVYSYLNQLKEGDTINLTVKRDGKKMDISYKSDTNVRYLLGCNFNGDDTSSDSGICNGWNAVAGSRDSAGRCDHIH